MSSLLFFRIVVVSDCSSVSPGHGPFEKLDARRIYTYRTRHHNLATSVWAHSPLTEEVILSRIALGRKYLVASLCFLPVPSSRMRAVRVSGEFFINCCVGAPNGRLLILMFCRHLTHSRPHQIFMPHDLYTSAPWRKRKNLFVKFTRSSLVTLPGRHSTDHCKGKLLVLDCSFF